MIILVWRFRTTGSLGELRRVREGVRRCVMTQAAVNMAALSAELRFRDGQRQKICVNVENNLSALIHGVQELNQNVSRLLSELVEREKTRGDCAEGEEEDEDSDEGDEEPPNSQLQPPAKRSKTGNT